ncbi:MAG: sodium:solute symporter family protein [Candidatus Thiodiazotropha endolucinida]
MDLLDMFVYAGYLIFILGGLLVVRQAKTMGDFAVGHRQFTSVIAFATLSATAIGPGFTTGLIEKSSTDGIIWVVIFSFFAIQMLLTGVFVAPRLRQFPNALTLGDVMGAAYGPLAKVLTGVIAIVISVAIVGAIAKATGTFVNVITGINSTISIVVSTLIVLLYSTIGGIKADVFTDVLQFVIITIGIPLILLFLLFDTNFSPAIEAISFENYDMPLTTFIALAGSFLLGEFLLPPYAARAFSARSASDAKRAFIYAGLFSAIWFIVVGVIGILGISRMPGVPVDEVFITLVKDVLPAGVTGLALASITAIIASSQDSFLNSASVSFTRDIHQVVKSKDANNPQLTTTKTICFLIGLASVFIALYVPSIIDALLIAYTLWAPTIVIPLLVALFYKEIPPIAGPAGIIAGGVVTTLWITMFEEPSGIPSIYPGLLACAVGTLLAGLLGSKSSNSYLLQPIKPYSIDK